MALTFAAPDRAALPIYLLAPGETADWLTDQPEIWRPWVEAAHFDGQSGRSLILPSETGAPAAALYGLGPPEGRDRIRFGIADLRRLLPDGVWRLATPMEKGFAEEAALGWLLAGYRFTKYSEVPPVRAELLPPEGVDPARIEAIAAGEVLTRDLINTPAMDMGPADLTSCAEELAATGGASVDVVEGEALDQGFPMIAAVGAAAAGGRGPRLIDMRWGHEGPTVTLVGKGVCFDTGGLNLKPGSSMGLMKKDMGGAAVVLGLAQTIMALQLPLRLRVLIPAVENAVAGAAFRPGDILRSRQGLTVEVNNTDAEGRLVLADALTFGAEEGPDLMVSLATLTGAARVAVGPDIAPFYTDDEDLATQLKEAGDRVRDPVWRMPFWPPYEEMIEPGIADLDNAPSGGFAGSITAALFLRRFTSGAQRYAHFDIFGWQPKAAPARPKGGVGQGGRALLHVLSDGL